MCGRENVSWHRKQEGVVFCDVIDTDVMRKSVDMKVLYLQATTLHDSTTKVPNALNVIIPYKRYNYNGKFQEYDFSIIFIKYS